MGELYEGKGAILRERANLPELQGSELRKSLFPKLNLGFNA